MKKVFASVTALALAASAVSALSAGASAIGTDKIDFEDGDFSFVYLNTDQKDCVASGLEVADHNGSKALHLYVPDGQIPKVWFDLDSICDRSVTTQIMSISLEISAEPHGDDAVICWHGGTIGSAGGFDRVNMKGGDSQCNPNWSQQDNAFDISGWEIGKGSAVNTAEKKFLLPASRYTDLGTNPFFCVMVWNGDQPSCKATLVKKTVDDGEGNKTETEELQYGTPVGYDLYIDNIILKDKDGNALNLGVSAAAPAAAETEAVTEAATEAATEAPAEEVAEPETEAAEEVAEDEIVLEEPEFVPESDDEPIAVEEAAPVVEEAAPAAVEAAPAAVPATSNTNTGNASAAAIVSVMALAAAAMAVSKRK